MADVDFDEFEGGFDVPSVRGIGRWANIAGAACSVALVAGLGVWGYKLAVRDVSGIPVVRALEGPLRIAPATPGGELAMHQGLSVNAVAAAGTAMPLPEKLTLAPREAELTAEDSAGSAVLAALPSGAAELSVQSDLTIQETLPDEDLSAEAPSQVAMDRPVEIAAVPMPDVSAEQPLPATQEEAVAAALAAALADDGQTVSEDVAAPATASVAALRPKARPGSRVSNVPQDAQLVSSTPAADVAAEPAVLAAASAAVSEIDPSTIPAGTRLVQLGAFDVEAGAREGWAALQGQFPDLMASKAMVIQSAQSGGRTFYRLRAHGFGTEDEARQFCATMLSENASCIPVAQR